MIDLTFGDSTAGSMKIAKSAKPGFEMIGVVTFIGGSPEEPNEVVNPRVWSGMAMEGSSRDVFPLSLALDVGDLSDMDDSMASRIQVLDMLFGDYEEVPRTLHKRNQTTISRLRSAASALEPIRMWISTSDPAELCGLYYICHFMRDSQVPLSVVRIPREIEKENTLVVFRSTGEIPPEAFGELADNEERLSTTQREAYTAAWQSLVRENAPLRAVVNGKLMGVPTEFYDFAIRNSIPQGDVVVAKILGRTLTAMPGVGDRWLFLRLQSMVRSGELTVVSEPTGEHPYSGVVRKSSRE